MPTEPKPGGPFSPGDCGRLSYHSIHCYLNKSSCYWHRRPLISRVVFSHGRSDGEAHWTLSEVLTASFSYIYPLSVRNFTPTASGLGKCKYLRSGKFTKGDSIYKAIGKLSSLIDETFLCCDYFEAIYALISGPSEFPGLLRQAWVELVLGALFEESKPCSHLLMAEMYPACRYPPSSLDVTFLKDLLCMFSVMVHDSWILHP